MDGKITSRASDLPDSDRDWKRLHGVKKGLRLDYDVIQNTVIDPL